MASLQDELILLLNKYQNNYGTSLAVKYLRQDLAFINANPEVRLQVTLANKNKSS